MICEGWAQRHSSRLAADHEGRTVFEVPFVDPTKSSFEADLDMKL